MGHFERARYVVIGLTINFNGHISLLDCRATIAARMLLSPRDRGELIAHRGYAKRIVCARGKREDIIAGAYFVGGRPVCRDAKLITRLQELAYR